MKTYKSKNAFTILELLAVIAIIAILTAILYPLFWRARENALRNQQYNQKTYVPAKVIRNAD